MVFQRYSHWRDLTEAETAAAVAELREIIGNRPDGPALLAEVAGILIGAREGELDEAKGKAAARLCIAAGADETLIPQWIQLGGAGGRWPCWPPFSAPSYRRFGGRDGWPAG